MDKEIIALAKDVFEDYQSYLNECRQKELSQNDIFTDLMNYNATIHPDEF